MGEIVERKLKPLDLNVGHDIGIALEYLKSLAALSNRLEVNSELARKVRAGAAAGQKGDLAQVKVMVFQIRKEIKEAGQRGGRGAGGQKLRSQGREKENKAEAEAERA